MNRVLILLSIVLIWTCSSSSSKPTEPTVPTQPPTVNNLTLTTNEDTPTTFTMTGSDPEGAALTFSISTQPQNGTVTASGAAGTYTPNANFNGTDTFAYIASDGALSSTAGLVSVTVTAVDDDPNSMNVSAVTDEDNAVEIILEAEEYDGDTISFNIKDTPTSGTVSLTGDKATYTPNENYFGSDSFTFEAVDYTAKKILNTATASITINPINDAPVVEDITVEEWNNKDITITLTGTDVEGDNITFHIVDNPVNVNAAIDGTTLTINKSSSFWGADSLTYYAYDGTNYGETAKVDITFKRYINYNRSSYELKHNDLWIEEQYFWNSFGIGPNAHGASEVDLNGDGYTDVLAAQHSEDNIRKQLSIFINNGDNQNFTLDNSLIQNNTGTIFMRKELIGDFNGDNYPDIFFIGHGTHAVGEEHLSSLMSNEESSYNNYVYDSFPAGFFHGGASADVDLDGDLDIFVAAGNTKVSGKNHIFLENNGGIFNINSNLLTNDSSVNLWEAEFYDLNKDNYPDLIISAENFNESYKPQNYIYWNNGGVFTDDNRFILPSPEKPSDVGNYGHETIDYCFSDLDGDGNVEIIGSVTWGGPQGYQYGNIVIYSHSGDYNFQDVTQNFIENYSQQKAIYRIRLQDIDNNGKIDLINDFKESSGFPVYALRWEWNGSKFIAQF